MDVINNIGLYYLGMTGLGGIAAIVGVVLLQFVDDCFSACRCAWGVELALTDEIDS